MTDTTNAMTDTISNNTTSGEQIDDGGPAFPFDEPLDNGAGTRHWLGMRKREAAAIALCVPDSGLAWLDTMIVEARRLDYAGQALIGVLSKDFSSRPDERAHTVLLHADALIAAIAKDRT